MAGLQSQDRITAGNGANSADGMTRFYNQVRSRLIFHYFMRANLLSSKRYPAFKMNFDALMRT